MGRKWAEESALCGFTTGSVLGTVILYNPDGSEYGRTTVNFRLNERGQIANTEPALFPPTEQDGPPPQRGIVLLPLFGVRRFNISGAWRVERLLRGEKLVLTTVEWKG